MSTPHNAASAGEIAKTVLMPGDPLRAKWIAETFLSDVVCFNTVRGMLGYTGLYEGKRVSVMGHGMGMPSIGIYSYELYHFYDVDTILRVGSAGALADDVTLRDIVLAMGACTDSNYAAQYQLAGSFAPIADFSLLLRAAQAAERKKLSFRVGNVLSTDAFYNADKGAAERWREMGVLAVDMEAAALYMNAAAAGKRALTLLTVSDHLFQKGELSAQERQTGFEDMLRLALEIAP
ncbi:MAG: purine-nucleoside phosphorylase [Acutalibacteraceae bacterium]